ncbi:MAG: AAA family ATPase [Bacteroidetes bacterium]|nr:AAA family ATPase [Bacteroidota bacterium]MBS1978852.1 AAA family ATPase [Bacteroidota bacterium]
MKIFLLGLPGSGKTTIGNALASQLNLQFVDLDAEIEKNAGESIASIFSKKGEDHFREIEKKELEKWCTGADSFVMATGGGTPCFYDNLSLMKLSGLTIFLDVPVQVIADRLRQTALEDRPLFARTSTEELESHLESLRSKRISFYHLAHHTVEGSEISISTLLQVIKTGTPR